MVDIKDIKAGDRVDVILSAYVRSVDAYENIIAIALDDETMQDAGTLFGCIDSAEDAGRNNEMHMWLDISEIHKVHPKTINVGDIVHEFRYTDEKTFKVIALTDKEAWVESIEDDPYTFVGERDSFRRVK